MQTKEFMTWLCEVKGMKHSSARSRVSNCETVEEYEGDLDTLFKRDNLSNLLSRLSYSKSDEKNNIIKSHNIPIDGNIYNGTATYRSAVTRYLEFKEYSLSMKSDNNQKTTKEHFPAKYFQDASIDMGWPTWELPSSNTLLKLLKMITPYIRFLHPSIVEAVVEDNEVHKSFWRKKLLEHGINPDFYLWEKSSCAFPGIRRYSGRKEIAFYHNQIEKKDFQLIDALRLDDNSFPKHIWSFLFRGKAFQNIGPSGYSLAHLADHKEYKNRVYDEFDAVDNQYLKFYGLYTSVSNTIYIPDVLLKPTDFNSDIRIVLLNKAQDLYGNVCNIIHPSFNIKPSIWSIHDFDWAEPVGDVAHIEDFFDFRLRIIESLWSPAKSLS